MIEGHVAKLLNDTELLINRGRDDGVKVSDVFAVIDTSTHNVKDPITGENLGSLNRVKVQVQVTQVDKRLALCVARRGSTIFDLGRALGSRPALTSTLVTGVGPAWPEEVKPGDPVMQVQREPRSVQDENPP